MHNDSLNSAFHKCFPSLTQAQATCTYLYAKGMTSAQIGQQIGISRQGVDKHLHASIKKMGIVNLSCLRQSVLLDILLITIKIR